MYKSIVCNFFIDAWLERPNEDMFDAWFKEIQSSRFESCIEYANKDYFSKEIHRLIQEKRSLTRVMAVIQKACEDHDLRCYYTYKTLSGTDAKCEISLYFDEEIVPVFNLIYGVVIA